MRQYLISVAAVCLLQTLISTALPESKIKKMAALAGSLLIILTVISPVASLDTESIAGTLSQFILDTEMARTGIEVHQEDLLRDIIKDNCETYILDKASSMGLTLQAEITLSDTEGTPYPTGVKIKGEMTVEQMQKLSRYISEDLGIPADKQEWM